MGMSCYQQTAKPSEIFATINLETGTVRGGLNIDMRRQVTGTEKKFVGLTFDNLPDKCRGIRLPSDVTASDATSTIAPAEAEPNETLIPFGRAASSELPQTHKISQEADWDTRESQNVENVEAVNNDMSLRIALDEQPTISRRE